MMIQSFYFEHLNNFDIFCYFDLYFRWHHLATLYIIVMSVQYWTFSVLFFICPLNIQWVLGIAMTIVREANVLILTSICTRVASNKVTTAVVYCLNVVTALLLF